MRLVPRITGHHPGSGKSGPLRWLGNDAAVLALGDAAGRDERRASRHLCPSPYGAPARPLNVL